MELTLRCSKCRRELEARAEHRGGAKPNEKGGEGGNAIRKLAPRRSAADARARRPNSSRRVDEMPHLRPSCLALAVVASGTLAPDALDRAFLLADLPGPLAGAPHG